jgi:CubicO group peptidase (beta-lactamase class C family)
MLNVGGSRMRQGRWGGLAVLAGAVAGLAGPGLKALPAQPPPVPALDASLLDSAYRRAARLPRLRSLLVSHRGVLVRERYYNGASRDRPANIKSASKSVLSALIGIAIERGDIAAVSQPIASYFAAELATDPDRRKGQITIGDLLTMRSGLRTTSFYNYGRWVTSRNWVRFALAQPLVADPGAEMEYSTGNTHLLSALLTRASQLDTWEYANRHLARPLGIALPRWQRDPQGVYFGGNDMHLTPRAMVAFGNLYSRRGRSAEGRQIVPAAWVDSSFVPRARSGWSGMEYGYGWWTRPMAGHDVRIAWGYGGQFIFVVPELALTIVATSDPTPTRRGDDHLDAVYDLVAQFLIPAVPGR